MTPVRADALEFTGKETRGRGLVLRALAALFVLTIRQHLRGRRLIVISLLFLLPSVLAVLVQFAPHAPPPAHLEFAFVFNIIPHALATLTALLYAAGIVQDEVEEQTLTYLLLRPLPRWALYVTKWSATVLVTSVLTGTFTVLALVVLYWNAPDSWREVFLNRAPRITLLFAVAQTGYCAFFGFVSLLTRRSIIVGIAYIILFEGLLASFDTVARHLTVMYYLRVLVLRWFDPPDGRVWSIDLAQAPTVGDCMLTLLTSSLLFVVAGAWLMMRREFRMKTPEGS